MNEKQILKKLIIFISRQAKESRSQWKEELWESEDIEKFGFNEYVGGKADAYEDCLEQIDKLRSAPAEK